jgi:arginase
MPYHLGMPAVGMGLGPTALLERHGLADALGPNVAVEVIPAPDQQRPEISRTFELARALAERVSTARAAQRLPLVLAGNCNSCLGTVAGLRPERLGVVWFDAHADFDTPEDNESGFLDVMALATLTGAGWQALRRSIPGFRDIPEADVVLVGVRDLEPYQRARLESSQVQVLFGERIRSAAVGALLEPALDDLLERTRDIYLHVDLDVLDPSEGRANEYAAPGGLSLAELEQALRLVGSRFTVAGAAMTAYNPDCDPSGAMASSALRVAKAIQAAAA